MICTKCNNEIPDGAKFCTSCGAAISVPAPEKKSYCEKCGLELAPGAKFCSVCGGAAYAKDAAPTENVENTFDMGNMPAVSLDKPLESDGLVSAMNSAAAAAPSSAPMAYGAAAMPSGNMPMPSGDPAMPSYAPTASGNPVMPSDYAPMPSGNMTAPSGSAGIPMPSNGGFNNGYTAPAPTFAPSANAADTSGAFAAPEMGNMSMYGGGAAAAVRPVKKKHKGRVALIIAIAVAVLLGAVAVFFFTNRATFLSIVMGKSKYAAMVEGTHIKQVTDNIDMKSLSDGIKSASSVYQMVTSGVDADSFNLLGMTNNIYGKSASSARMSYGYGGFGYGSDMEYDLTAIEKMYAELLQSTYGKNSVNGSVKAKVEIGSSLRSLMGSGYDLDQMDEVLDYLNKTEITYSVSASDDTTAFTVGTNGKLTVNAKVMMNGQDMYISLPFVSDKAIKLTFDKPADTTVTELDLKPLELDASELERIIGDIIKIYLEHYKNLKIDMGNGEISVADITVSGKLITADFSGKDLFELFEDVAEYIAHDDYLAGKIVDFANSCGMDIDKSDYADAILKDFDNAVVKETAGELIIKTVINRSGDVLGKSYEMVSNGEKVSCSFADTNGKSGAEITASMVTISMLNEKTDDQNGTCTLKTSVAGASVSLVLKYSDVKEAEFCGKKINTGKYELSMKLPNSFKDMLDKNSYAAINGAKITYSASVAGDTLETSFGITAPGYIDISLTDTVTALDDSSALSVPSNVIDVTHLTKGDYLDDKTAEEFGEFAKELVKALEDMGIDTGVDNVDDLDLSALSGKMPKESVDQLLEYVEYYIDDVDMYIEYADDDKVAALTEIKNKFKTIEQKIRSKNYSITYDEYIEFSNELSDAAAELYQY